MVNYYRRRGHLKSDMSACRPMACAYGTSAHDMFEHAHDMFEHAHGMFGHAHDMFEHVHDRFELNMVTLGVYMHDSARIPISTAAMHHHPPTTR